LLFIDLIYYICIIILAPNQNESKIVSYFYFTDNSKSSCSDLNSQKRFQSDVRKYYNWNKEFRKYELVETEYENSVIDIREIGSKTNGYIVISMVDNGSVRMHHGSIYQFAQDSEETGSWLIRSKFL